jgi:hypothetical protein
MGVDYRSRLPRLYPAFRNETSTTQHHSSALTAFAPRSLATWLAVNRRSPRTLLVRPLQQLALLAVVEGWA